MLYRMSLSTEITEKAFLVFARLKTSYQKEKNGLSLAVCSLLMFRRQPKAGKTACFACFTPKLAERNVSWWGKSGFLWRTGTNVHHCLAVTADSRVRWVRSFSPLSRGGGILLATRATAGFEKWLPPPPLPATAPVFNRIAFPAWTRGALKLSHIFQ